MVQCKGNFGKWSISTQKMSNLHLMDAVVHIFNYVKFVNHLVKSFCMIKDLFACF